MPRITFTFTRVSTLLIPVGLPKRPCVTGKGGLLRGSPRLPSRELKQRGLFAADVCPGPETQFEIEPKAGAHHVVAEEPLVRALAMAFSSRASHGVLAAQVDVALLRGHGEAGDGHGLDQGERIALHHHAVFERAGLGLVGVAHDVVRTRGLLGHRLPLHASRKSSAATTEELRVFDLADGVSGTDLDGPAQSLVAAVGAVVVEGQRIDHAHASKQATPGGRTDLRPGLDLELQIVDAGPDPLGCRRSEGFVGPTLPRFLDQSRGRAFAQAQARTLDPHEPFVLFVGRANAFATGHGNLGGPVHAADHVVAHVNHGLRPLFHREHGVEGGHTVNLGRRHTQTARDVIETARTDPAHTILERVQSGEKETATLKGAATLAGHARRAVGGDGGVGAENRIDDFTLVV
jgi:hypothetical protein